MIEPSEQSIHQAWRILVENIDEEYWVNNNEVRDALESAYAIDMRRVIERCAQIAEGFEANRDWVPGSLWGNIRRDIAAEIRTSIKAHNGANGGA